MSIEINRLSGKQVQNTGDNRQAAPAKSGTAPKSQPGGSSGDDRVSLTNSAANLQELSTRISQLPMVDETLVTETLRAVATGSFQFQPATAADNLVTQEKELATLEVQS